MLDHREGLAARVPEVVLVDQRVVGVVHIEADALQITDSSDVLGTALAAARSVDASVLQQQGHSGKALGDAIRQARIEAIAMAMQAAGTPD